MKKLFLLTPFVFLLNLFSFNGNLESASCSSHKNRNVKVECSLTDENCDNNKLDKKFKKVGA
tara:strand:+ start:376 stop:561 length:186 start_codon:yes stop_codon:yes gene_type:complete